MMELHQEFAPSPFLFSLVMDAPIHHIQGEVSWCMLFVHDIIDWWEAKWSQLKVKGLETGPRV